MPLPWFIPILINLAVMALTYVLAPKPKKPKPEAVKDLESPTAEAGREVMVIFGTLTISDPNILWSGDKARRTYQVKA